MPTSVVKFGDSISGVVRTADGRLKIKLTREDFPLTCKEGDIIDIQRSAKEWEVYRITDEKR